MVIKSVNLETVCGVTSEFPENEHFEVAFAGKSNVGKSSLINGLVNRNGLARTSSQPGKTQTINFYNINESMYLVDLPGYGYARANEEIKAQWGKMIERYLHTSEKLQAVFLLIDIRHEPSDNDRLMYQWMVEQGFAPIIIATKSDKLKKGQINQHIWAIEKGLDVLPDTTIIPFSAETKEGREEIWQLIESLVYTEEELEAMAIEQAEKKARKAAVAEEPQKKARWKNTDKAVAKKTAKKQAAKKEANKEAAKKERQKRNRERFKK